MKLVIGSRVTTTDYMPYVVDEQDIKYHDLWARVGMDVGHAIGDQALEEDSVVIIKRFKRGVYTECVLVECNGKEYWLVKKYLQNNCK